MSEVIFEAGDIVTCAFFGDREFVLIGGVNSDYPCKIESEGEYWSFTLDGKYHISHTSPVLKLVRKKQKEREWIQVFRVTCKNKSFHLGKNEFDSHGDALSWIRKSGIPSWEYQIEKFYKVKEQLWNICFYLF